MGNRNNSLWLMTGGGITLCLVLLICGLSVKAAENEGWEYSIFGSGAKLQNTITLPGEQIEELEISYSSQNVYFYLSNSDDIVIEEYLRSSAESAKAKVSLTGGRAVVTGGNKPHVSFNFFISGEERIQVYLPDKLFQRLSVAVRSGNVRAQEGFRLQCKELSLEAASGNIRWEGIQAEEANVEVSSGNITLVRAKGRLNAKASSGNIIIEHMEGSGAVEAKSGNIKVSADAITGDLSMEASSGNVKLELPDDLQFQFSAETNSGNIRTDFDEFLSYNEKGNYAHGSVGESPEIQIEMRAKSGNVRAVQ